MKYKKIRLGKFLYRSLLALTCFAAAICTPVANGMEPATIKHVVDGDTLKVIYEGLEESVRLIGIDTPESKRNAKSDRDALHTGQDQETILVMGKEATRFVRSIVKKGDTVQIEFDIQQRDKYGRLLGYVYLRDGRMMNELIIKSGYANLMTIPPNVKYQQRFQKAYSQAREARRGLFR